jgi:hypothetical protein
MGSRLGLWVCVPFRLMLKLPSQSPGASISVYGLLNQQSGRLSSTYSIDGGTPVTFTAYNGTQKAAPNVWTLSQRFFYKEVIPGNHTLTVKVSEVTGSQTFWVDYLTFEGTSSTSLIPVTPAKSGTKFTEKLIGGIVAGAIVALIILSCLRARYGKRLKAWWVQGPSSKFLFHIHWLDQRFDTLLDQTYIPEHIPPPIYEPPRQPPHLPMPSHPTFPEWYDSRPVVSDPAVPQLQREIENLRRENERIQRETAERARREAAERSQRDIAERIQMEANERARRQASERIQRDATERPLPPLTTTALAADAGPAEPPPPYSDSHYIP